MYIVNSNVGAMYMNEQGVPQDFDKALEYFLKAANQGDSDALMNIGTLPHSPHFTMLIIM